MIRPRTGPGSNGEANKTIPFISSGNVLIALKWQEKAYISVNGNGDVVSFAAGGKEGSPEKLWRNITVEKYPSIQDSVVLKSVHGKYMKLAWKFWGYVADFNETEHANATPVVPVHVNGRRNAVAFEIKGESGNKGYVKWLVDNKGIDVLSWELIPRDTYSTFSTVSRTDKKYIACNFFSQTAPGSNVHIGVSLRKMHPSYECLFKVERLKDGKVYIKPYLGGYLELDTEGGEIRVCTNAKRDSEAAECPSLSFRYVMLDNDHVAFMAGEDPRFVRPDGDTLKASSKIIKGDCVFAVTELFADKLLFMT